MRTSKYFVGIFFVVAVLFLGASSAEAQVVYGASLVGYDPPTQEAYGASTTYLDYVAGWYYDPVIVADLYRTDNPETSLDADSDIGLEDVIPAYVELESSNYVPGRTYCTFGNHRIRAYYVFSGTGYYWDPWGYGFLEGPGGGPFGEWWNPYGYGYYSWIGPTFTVGFTNPCIMIPLPPTPTPTPTPTPDPPCEGENLQNCSTPTPTPTPTPQPSPTVKIVDVGFKDDMPIRKLSTGNYIEEPNADGTVASWADDDNPDHPIAYAKTEDLKIFANFEITPTLSSPIAAKVRIKKGSTVLTPSPYISVWLNGDNLNIPSVTIDRDLLETGSYVRMSKYKFKWEISYDDGSTWKGLGDDSEHKIHWLNSRPSTMAAPDFKPFKNAAGTEYQGLFDVALEWSTGKVDNNESDLNKVAQKINARMAQKISYNPGTSAITSDNPLTFMDDSSPEAVCDDNARILAGLLKSIGLPDVTIKFSWGGEESTDKFNYFCVNGGCPGAGTNLVNKSSMQVSRPQLGKPGGPEDLESNPTFLYHATVDYNSKSYDPSYGIVDNGIQLLTAMKIESGQSPTCVHDAAATALLVARNALRDRNPAINNNTNIVCSLRSQSRTADVRSFRFEETSSAAQKSTFNQSDGKWNIQDQFGEIRTIQGFTKGAWVSELTAGDFDGDGLIDPAVWETSGDFGYISSYYPSQVFSFTLRPREVDEKLVPGDYDGDGRADVAVWRGSDGRFTYWKSSNNQEEVVTYWGGTAYGDVPAPGDYDGDGKTDIAIYRTSDGNWWIIRSSNGSSYFLNWGIATDIPVPADYDGDGKTDLAVVRPSEGVWYTLESGNNNAYRGYSGPTLGTNDQPVPADYDGDGRIDFAVWFPATGEWSIGDGKTLATRIEYFGRDSGVPVASMNVFRP